MAIPITIETLGESIVDRTLAGVEGRIDDLSGAWPRVTNTLRDAMVKQFDSEGRSGSGGWAPLAPSTIARKRAKGAGTQILHDTLRLRKSLTIKGSRDGVDRVYGTLGEFGTTVPYAIFHQTGTATMPRRRPVQLSEQQRRDVARELQRYAMGTAV